MATTLTQTPDSVILQHISWPTYQSLLQDFEQEPAIRLTYNNGDLEIRMPRDPHETFKKLLGRLIETLTEEMGLEIRSLGSRTCDRQDLAKGLEPDQCYYIQHEALVRNLDQIDLQSFPPPDLAIEIDITSSSLNRLAIYASLGIPEIWRYSKGNLSILQRIDQNYQEIDRSLALPLITTTDLTHWLNLRTNPESSLGETTWIRQFRQWVRTQQTL